VLVDLDSNIVKFMSSSLSFAATSATRQSMPQVAYKPCYTFTRLPSHLSWRLYHAITRHFNLWKLANPHLHPQPPIGLPAQADPFARHSHIPDAKQGIPPNLLR
jgi:hypothetical protein